MSEEPGEPKDKLASLHHAVAFVLEAEMVLDDAEEDILSRQLAQFRYRLLKYADRLLKQGVNHG